MLVADKKGRTGWDTHCHKQYFLAQTHYPNETLLVLNKRLVIIIIKRISRAPIYHTRWQHRVLYNNTNHTHTHTHTQSVGQGDGQGCEKQFRNNYLTGCLEGGFERGGRIRVAECLRQIVPVLLLVNLNYKLC